MDPLANVFASAGLTVMEREGRKPLDPERVQERKDHLAEMRRRAAEGREEPSIQATLDSAEKYPFLYGE